jgi:hypothetical protein
MRRTDADWDGWEERAQVRPINSNGTGVVFLRGGPMLAARIRELEVGENWVDGNLKSSNSSTYSIALSSDWKRFIGKELDCKSKQCSCQWHSNIEPWGQLWLVAGCFGFRRRLGGIGASKFLQKLVTPSLFISVAHSTFVLICSL